jgi:hypothetical protein
MPLPPLKEWENSPSQKTLHQAAQVLSIFKKAGVAHDGHFFHHLALHVVPFGLTSGPTAQGEYQLDLKRQAVSFLSLTGENHTYPLQDATQADLARKLQADQPSLSLDVSALTADEVWQLDAELATQMADALSQIQSGLATGRDALDGFKSHVVLFPHHFDLSFLWFRQEGQGENAPHINFGFSTGDSTFPRPYVYAYIWLGDKYLMPFDAPHPARHDAAWPNGAVIDYDTLRYQTDWRVTLMGFMLGVLNAAENAGL